MKPTDQPLVSIITPVYNAERFILETIKTAQDQTYTNWELILVDDVSSDGSKSLIRRMQKKDSRIKLLLNTENIGAGPSRNRAIEASTGRFIAFLDADDLWVPEKLRLQVSTSLERNEPFIFSSYWFANECGKATSSPVQVPKKIGYKQALRNHIIWTSTVLIDTSLIEKELTLMPDVKRGQDMATWWRILQSTGVQAVGITKPLALYRRSSTSLSANKIKALKRTWKLMRETEGLSISSSIINFVMYAVNAVKKRIK